MLFVVRYFLFKKLDRSETWFNAQYNLHFNFLLSECWLQRIYNGKSVQHIINSRPMWKIYFTVKCTSCDITRFNHVLCCILLYQINTKKNSIKHNRWGKQMLQIQKKMFFKEMLRSVKINKSYIKLFLEIQRSNLSY